VTDTKGIDLEKEQIASELRGSYIEFCRVFFQLITRREFIISQPTMRESHHIELARIFTKVIRCENEKRGILINIPPGYGKSVMVSLFIAWSYTHYSDANFIYTSYSQDLAAKNTDFIKTIMSSDYYRYLFGVELRRDSKSRDKFQTTDFGSVRAYGTAGAITGQDAGLPGQTRFSGAIIIDDPIKPDEAHSEVIRNSVLKNYMETIRQRARGFNVPIICIAQRLHEYDLPAFFLSGDDTIEWDTYVIKALDDNGNALYPEVTPLDDLLLMQDKSPYVFASQFQQDPIPAGGGLYKPNDFITLDEDPEMLCTFITADTAETDKDYNDASVFSFWGVYEIETLGRKTGVLGLHWLDCQEMRLEPKQLQDAFLDFWTGAMRYKVQPQVAAIEKKSTGVTLLSVLSDMRGIQVRNIERTKASGSKTKRFLELQPIVASKRISFTKDARHKQMCINHMSKITANDTHRHDDICDTVYDAVKIALIDKSLVRNSDNGNSKRKVMNTLSREFEQQAAARDILYYE
jgi:predicted phage terminase large subunit-like protein